jgi:hypothetical protein
VLWALLEHGGLPEEGGKLARAGDRDFPHRLSPFERERAPAAVEAALRAPGDLADPRVLTGLSARESFVEAWLVAVVVCGLDEQAAAVGGAGLDDAALATLLVGGALARDEPEVAGEQSRCAKRRKPPISAQRPAAERVSMPRKQRSRAIVSAKGLAGASSASACSIVSHRCGSASSAAR